MHNPKVAGMTMDLWPALWASGVGGVAGSKRLGVSGLVEGWAQLQGLGLNLARASRLINITHVDPTERDRSLLSFLSGPNQHGFN